MSDLVPVSQFIPGTFSGQRYELPENISRDDWLDIGRIFGHIDENRQWWIGHWWNQGTRRYGDFATAEAKRELKERTGLDYYTVRRYGLTVLDVERRERRREKTLLEAVSHEGAAELVAIATNSTDVAFWVHDVVAQSGLPDYDKDLVTERVANGEIPKTQLALGDAIREVKRTFDTYEYEERGGAIAAPVDAIQATYMVVIDCDNEQQQRQLLRRFLSEGLQCRALTV